jgi:hypothetical protein
MVDSSSVRSYQCRSIYLNYTLSQGKTMAITKGNLLYEIAQKLVHFLEENGGETLKMIESKTDMENAVEKAFLEQTRNELNKHIGDMKYYLKDKDTIAAFIETALFPIRKEVSPGNWEVDGTIIFQQLEKQQKIVFDKLKASGKLDNNQQAIEKITAVFEKQKNTIVRVLDYFNALCDVYTLK